VLNEYIHFHIYFTLVDSQSPIIRLVTHDCTYRLLTRCPTADSMVDTSSSSDSVE